MRTYLGIDIGSRAVKVLLAGEEGDGLAQLSAPAGFDGPAVASGLVEQACRLAGVARSQVRRAVVTGYGRVRFEGADEEISEITCHARGARHLVPQARTVIDIGGQDSKVIGLDPQGRVTDFAMNDRCAAGTGRFLEVMAEALGLSLDELAALHARARSPVAISSTCTVFAESEVISHLARGVGRPEIVAGLHAAIASRLAGLGARVGFTPVVVCTGGVSCNAGVVAALSTAARTTIVVPPGAQFAGALGAALLAAARDGGGGDRHSSRAAMHMARRMAARPAAGQMAPTCGAGRPGPTWRGRSPAFRPRKEEYRGQALAEQVRASRSRLDGVSR